MSLVFLFFAKTPLVTLTQHRPSFGSFEMAGYHVHSRYADSALVLLERSGEKLRGTSALSRLTQSAAIEAGGTIEFAFVELLHKQGDEDGAARMLSLSAMPFDPENILIDCRYRTGNQCIS